MPFRLAPIAPVLLGVLTAQLALGLLTTLIPVLLVGRGTDAATIGAVASCYFVGFLCGTLFADRLVRQVGHIRAFAVFAALAADAALVMALWRDPWVWGACRLLMGFQMAGLFLVSESWLNDKADGATRGRTFGAYLLVSWGGSAAGPLALNVIPASATLFLATGMAFATALLPMALSQVDNPSLGSRRRLSLLRLVRASPLGVACCLTSGLINSSYYALSPVFLQRMGHTPDAVPPFVSATMVAALLVQYPMGYLSDRLGRRPVTVAAMGGGAIVAVVLANVATAPFLVLAGLGALFAGLTSPLYGLGAGQVNDHVEREDYVAASGGLLLAWSIGASIGPSLAGGAMSGLGGPGLFVYLACVTGLLALFTLARMRARPSVPLDLQGNYVPAPSKPVSLPALSPRPEPTGTRRPDLETAA